MQLPSRESWCRQMCWAKSLQRLVLSTTPVVFLSFCIFLLLSSALCVHFARVGVSSCVCMFECVIMRVCACGFIEILGNTVGNYQRNLQQCSVSLSFSDSRLCYLQMVCDQLRIILRRSSFPWLAQSFLFFMYKVFVSSLREWFTHHCWGGGKTEVPTCPWVKGQKLKRRAKISLSL